MAKVYEWINTEKLRYYTITLLKDEVNANVLYYQWGSCVSNRGGKKEIRVQSEEEAQEYIDKMKKRRKIRGYFLINPMNRNPPI
jgi:hypothetical protein